MALREILKRGDPVLNKRAHPVTKFDEKLCSLLDDMHETLDEAGGAGLAAPQVGILRRVVLVADNDDNILELINPHITAAEGEQDGLEGCLSVPGYWGFVKRPAKVRVKAQNREGNWFEVEGEGVTARCFCHELDHLDGQLYTDLTNKLYTSEEIDEMVERRKQEREGQSR
jgi:peptide deformylase